MTKDHNGEIFKSSPRFGDDANLNKVSKEEHDDSLSEFSQKSNIKD